MRYIILTYENPQTEEFVEGCDVTVEGDCSIDVPDSPYIEVKSMQETPTTAVKGFYVPEGDIEVGMDLQTAPMLMFFAMGGYHFDTGNNEHLVYINEGNVLPSFAAAIGKENRKAINGQMGDGFEHLFRGCTVDSFNIDITDDLAMLKMSVKSKGDKLNPIKTAVRIPDYYPIAFYNLHAYLDGDDVSQDTKSVDLSVGNNIDEEKGKGFGSMFASELLSDGKEITIDSTIAFRGSKYLRLFWGSDDAVEQTPNVKFFKYELKGRDMEGNEFHLICPKVFFNKVSQAVEGREAITHETTIGVLKGEYELEDGKVLNTSVVCRIRNKDGALPIDTL